MSVNCDDKSIEIYVSMEREDPSQLNLKEPIKYIYAKKCKIMYRRDCFVYSLPSLLNLPTQRGGSSGRAEKFQFYVSR